MKSAIFPSLQGMALSHSHLTLTKPGRVRQLQIPINEVLIQNTKLHDLTKQWLVSEESGHCKNREAQGLHLIVSFLPLGSEFLGQGNIVGANAIA